MKRMLNVVRMRTKIAKRRFMPVDEALVAKLALFERCTDAASVTCLYREINASSDGKPEFLAKLAQQLDDEQAFADACPKEWKANAAFIREWLTLDPPLTGVNLRPLVYLSRETMPLRSLRGGLSEAATEGLRVLLRTNKTASRSAATAANAILEAERPSVMKAMIESMRSHADWREPPSGIHGALILAKASAKAASDLRAFISLANPTKLPPWLGTLIRDEPWFKNGEQN